MVWRSNAVQWKTEKWKPLKLSRKETEELNKYKGSFANTAEATSNALYTHTWFQKEKKQRGRAENLFEEMITENFLIWEYL